MAGTLDGNLGARQGRFPEPGRHRCFDAVEYAECGPGGRVAARTGAVLRQTGDEGRLAVHDLHVVHGNPHVLSRDVPPLQGIDRAAECFEERPGLGRMLRGEYHRLAAAERQSRHGIFVGHAPRQAQRVGERSIVAGVSPAPAASRSGTQCGRVNGDDRLEAGGRLIEKVDRVVMIELGMVEYAHLSIPDA